MNNPTHHDEDEEEQGDVFLDESDIVQEITVDDEGESIFPLSFSLSLFCFVLFLKFLCLPCCVCRSS